MNVLEIIQVRRTAFLLMIAMVFSPQLVAQKKGGGSPSASASPAASSPSTPAASASSAPIEVEWLSYSALDKIMEKVATFSCSSTYKNIVVLDTPALQALQAYDSFYMQAESIKMAFADMAPTVGAGGGIDDFADITSAVTATAVATTSETSSSFTIQDPTAAIALLTKLHNAGADGCKKAFYAGVYEVSDTIKNVDTPTLVYTVSKDATEEEKKQQSNLTKQPSTKKLPSVPQELSDLAAAREQTLLTILGKLQSTSPLVCKAVATLAQGSSFSQTAGGWTPPTPAGWTQPVKPGGSGWSAPTPPSAGSTQPAPPVTAIGSTDPCLSAFNNLDGTYNSFLTSLSTANSTTGQTAISAAKQGHKLRALFKRASETDPLLGIYINVAAAGGTQQDRKNLLLSLFWGDLLRYSGGVSVNVIIFEAGGTKSKILFSDLVRYRTPLTHIEPPADHKGLNAGDNLGVIPSSIEAPAAATTPESSAAAQPASPGPSPQQ